MKNYDTQTLLDFLESPNEDDRNKAAYELQKRHDKRAIKPLVDLYVDPQRQPIPDSDGDVSTTIFWSLVAFGQKAVDELGKKVSHRGIPAVLGSIQHPSATPYLIDALYGVTDNTDWIFDKYMPILNALSACADPSAIPHLEYFLEHLATFNEQRNKAMSAIAKIKQRYSLD